MSKSISGLLLMFAMMAFASADDHQHSPLMVRSRPVIERVPLKVIHPVDLTITKQGETLVADSVGELLFRVDAAGVVSILGNELPGICRVVDSPILGAHVLLSNGRSGRVIHISDSGFQSEPVYLPFRPAGLGLDEAGNLLTANSDTGTVLRIDREGNRTVLTKVSEPVIDLVVDQAGTAVVLLRSGKLVGVFGEGNAQTLGYVPESSSRLKVHPDNSVVALATDTEGRSMLVLRTDDQQQVERFAGVPGGSISFAFDELGNLSLANADLRAVTKVTSHFRVPCPHCGELVPMVLSPDAPVDKRPVRRSF